MKNRFTKILCVVLTLAVLASMLVVATPASAGYNSWTLSTGPDGLNPVDVASIDIVDMAIASNGTTGYAVAGGGVYKTNDGGKTWTPTSFAGGNATQVTIAPDVSDGSFLAVVADGNEAWVSTDGALFSQMTGFTATTINDIAISPLVGTVRSVAIAADNSSVQFYSTGAGFGGGTSWTNIYTGNVTAGPVLAVAFSPNYLQDRTLVAVSTSGSNTILNLYNAATAKWNAEYTVYGMTGAGTNIATSNPATAADIALPGSFMALDAGLRTVYLALNPTGLYRNAYQLSADAMYSVAVNAAGDKLVAGRVAGNVVSYVASPATALTTGVVPSSKSPGYAGNTNVSVGFFGTSVGAATNGTESAFALSTDDAKTFNDVAFVDTVINITDFAVNADGTKMYIVTESGSVASLWRYTTSWERIYKAAGAGYIIRPAMDNFDAIFFVDKNTANILYSNDAGQASWQPRVAYGSIDDFAAESVSNLYVLTGTSVSKATDGGYLWDNPKTTTGAGAGASLKLLSAGNLLVAGATGVAYSTDGAATWTTTGLALPAATFAVADKLTAGGVIYASDNASIYKFTIGTSTGFGTAAVALAGANGLVLNNGVAYAMSATQMRRSPIIPGAAWGNVTMINAFGIKASTAGLFTVENGTSDALYTFTDIFAAAGPAQVAPADNYINPINAETGNANNIVFQWTPIANSPMGTTYTIQIALDSAFTQVVKTVENIVGVLSIVVQSASTTPVDLTYPYQSDTTYYWRVRTAAAFDSQWSATRKFKIDTLAPVSMVSPTNGATDVSLTPTFSWSPAAGATGYELVVSDDPTFAIITYSRTSTNPVFYSDEELAYSTVYYWKVRPTGASYPAAGTPYVMGIFTTMARPDETTTAPISITQTNPTITVSVPPANEVIPSYLLWIIIAIGAILVIALIVLIVRTRRVS